MFLDCNAMDARETAKQLSFAVIETDRPSKHNEFPAFDQKRPLKTKLHLCLFVSNARCYIIGLNCSFSSLLIFEVPFAKRVHHSSDCKWKCKYIQTDHIHFYSRRIMTKSICFHCFQIKPMENKQRILSNGKDKKQEFKHNLAPKKIQQPENTTHTEKCHLTCE